MSSIQKSILVYKLVHAKRSIKDIIIELKIDFIDALRNFSEISCALKNPWFLIKTLIL